MWGSKDSADPGRRDAGPVGRLFSGVGGWGEDGEGTMGSVTGDHGGPCRTGPRSAGFGPEHQSLVKTQMAGPHPTSFWFRGSGAGPEESAFLASPQELLLWSGGHTWRTAGV